MGKEHTYFKNLYSETEVLAQLQRLADEVMNALVRHGKKGKTVVLKVRYHSFETITRRASGNRHVQASDDIYEYAEELWAELGDAEKGIRLLGITVSNLEEAEHVQIPLF